MKRIKELQEQGFYVLEAINSANTHLIESQHELDQFFIFADAHFRNYMNIYDYCVTPVGWNILVQIKDEATIFEMHAKAQERRDKPVVWDQAWLILSNQVRLFRSRMTQWTNGKRGREGNASKEVYRRYMFTSLSEGREYIEKVREQELCFDQKIPKYQAAEERYDEDKQIAKDVGQLSSKTAQEGSLKRGPYMRSLKICDYVVKELEEWIRMTCAKHMVAYGDVGVRV